MNNQSLHEVLGNEMQDMLDAERQLTEALPKMAKAVHNQELRKAFEEHGEKTKGHVRRLEQAFKLTGRKPKTEPCKAMKGLIEECERALKDGKKLDDAADVDVIIAAQKVEHYEISAYGSLRAIAEKVGEPQLARLLEENLSEEKEADRTLTSITQSLFARAA